MTLQEKNAIQEYRDSLCKYFQTDIDQIILFGSKARGDDQENSDIDILVVVKQDDQNLKNQITDMAYDLMLKYGLDIEPVIVSTEEWNDRSRKPTSFSYCVQQEGRAL